MSELLEDTHVSDRGHGGHSVAYSQFRDTLCLCLCLCVGVCVDGRRTGEGFAHRPRRKSPDRET